MKLLSLQVTVEPIRTELTITQMPTDTNHSTLHASYTQLTECVTTSKRLTPLVPSFLIGRVATNRTCDCRFFRGVAKFGFAAQELRVLTLMENPAIPERLNPLAKEFARDLAPLRQAATAELPCTNYSDRDGSNKRMGN